MTEAQQKQQPSTRINDLPAWYREGNNGVLRMYNMFPRHYADFDAMTADLERVAKRGFSHVWTNPLQQTTDVEKCDWPAGTPNGNKGSLYSMRDPWRFNPDFSAAAKDASLSDDAIDTADREAILRFTAEARKQELVPVFDLVLSHLAPDSKIVDGTHPKLQQVDTTRWFARWPNGKPKRHGLDENNQPLPEVREPHKEIWDDVVMLDYDDPVIRQEIIDHLWKPFVEQYLELGFLGIRVDSVANNHPDVMAQVIEHFCSKFAEKYGTEPTIIGESLGGTLETQGKISPHATHLYNSGYWVRNLTGPNIGASDQTPQEFWGTESNWYQQEMGLKQKLVFFDPDGHAVPNRKGGTVGYAGSHDELPWIEYLRSEDGALDAKAAAQALREKIATVALASDGGWFLTSFDERLDTTLRTVFDNQKQGEYLGDLSDYVREINGFLKQMPDTQFGSWSRRYFLEDKPELVIIDRHSGFGYEGEANLIIVNTTPERPVALTKDDVLQLAATTRRELRDFYDPDSKNRILLGSSVSLPPIQQVMKMNAGEIATFASRVIAARARERRDNLRTLRYGPATELPQTAKIVDHSGHSR